MSAYFITATDTDAGKTFVSAAILRHWTQQGLKAIGFKPVASGCQQTEQGLRNDDALQLMAAASVILDYEAINPYSFVPAIAPHLAAQQAGVTIDLQRITEEICQYRQQADRILVEGVGGWQVPLNDRQTVAELAVLLNFPVILVVNLRLGCINHALLTARAIQQTGLQLAGWIANNAASPEQSMAYIEENIASIQSRINAPLLGVLPHFSPEQIKNPAFSGFIDLEKCN